MGKPESYTLADFGVPGWMDREEYREYQGIDIDHVRSLHRKGQEHLFGDNIAFVEISGLSFVISLYEIVSWDEKLHARTVAPSFRIHGTTFDGIREVQACADTSPTPEMIIEQMKFAIDFCDERGWKE